jgi:predicted DNA-binding transcriptional regulator AlpA
MKQTEQSAALRANQIAGPKGILPISLSTWWAGVKSGRYPQPTKLGPRVTVWRRDQVMELLEKPSA